MDRPRNILPSKRANTPHIPQVDAIRLPGLALGGIHHLRHVRFPLRWCQGDEEVCRQPWQIDVAISRNHAIFHKLPPGYASHAPALQTDRPPDADLKPGPPRRPPHTYIPLGQQRYIFSLAIVRPCALAENLPDDRDLRPRAQTFRPLAVGSLHLKRPI